MAAPQTGILNLQTGGGETETFQKLSTGSEVGELWDFNWKHFKQVVVSNLVLSQGGYEFDQMFNKVSPFFAFYSFYKKNIHVFFN